MDPSSATVIHSHLNTIQNLILLMMENNSRIIRHLDNVQSKLSACSTTFHEVPKPLDVDASLEDMQESEEVSAPLVIAVSEVDFALAKGLSSTVDNSEVFPELLNPIGTSLISTPFTSLVVSIGCTATLGTPVNSKIGLEDHPYSYACKVFAEIPDEKMDMEVERPVKNDSINPVTNVFDKMLHTVSSVKCEHSDLVMFDFSLALPCLISACSHAHLIGRAIFDYLRELDHAKLILSLDRFSWEQSELYFPFDPGSSFLTTYLGAPQNRVVWDVVGALFSVRFIPMQQPQLLLFGCIGLSFTLLNNAPYIDEDSRHGMFENLRWLFCVFHIGDVYFYVLLLELPTISILPKLDKLLSHCRKNALRTLMMVPSSSHSLCPLDCFLIKALLKSHFLYCGIVTATTFQLPLPRIYDSIWVATAGMKKKVNNASHSWDYTMLRVEQQIWNSNDSIALICAKLQLLHYILMIRVSTQNILDIHVALNFSYASGAILYIVTLGGTVLAPEEVVRNVQVPLPSIVYHMARNLHKTNVLLMNFSAKLFYQSVTLPLLFWLYLNLEDKVLISGRSIVVNTDSPKASQAIEPGAKPQEAPRIRQPNDRFVWDPG